MRSLSAEEEKYEKTYGDWFVSIPGILTLVVAILGVIASIVLAIVFSIWWVFFIGAATTAIVALLTYIVLKLTFAPIVVAINRLTEVRDTLREQAKAIEGARIKIYDSKPNQTISTPFNSEQEPSNNKE